MLVLPHQFAAGKMLTIPVELMATPIVEGTYHTSAQVHNPMETHGCVAVWEGGGRGVSGVYSGVSRSCPQPCFVRDVLKQEAFGFAEGVR